jgi:hypothetical protein
MLTRIIWENIAYLANDKRRAEAFAILKRTIGTRPDQILAAQHSALAAIGKAGILPDVSAEKLLTIAKIAYEVRQQPAFCSQESIAPSEESFEEISQHRRSGRGKDTLVYWFLSGDGARLEWLASAVSSGVCRGAEELFSDIPLGSGCDPWTTPQRLRFADPGTSVAPAARSRTVQAVKAALHRMSGQRGLQLRSEGLISGLPKGARRTR